MQIKGGQNTISTPVLPLSKLRIKASSRRSEPSNSSTGFQFGTRDRRSKTASELSSPFLCQAQVIFATLMGSGSASSWTSPYLMGPLPPFLSLFLVFISQFFFVQGLGELELEVWDLLGPRKLWSQRGILVRRADLAISSLSPSLQALRQPFGPH